MCPFCKSENSTDEIMKYNITIGDYIRISNISSDANFILSMSKLKHENPVEYELKMRQFKSLEADRSKPKCSKCGCTDFVPVRKKWSLLAGFATNKVEMVCKNCGAVRK